MPACRLRRFLVKSHANTLVHQLHTCCTCHPVASPSVAVTSSCRWQSLLVRPAALTIDFVFKKLHAIAIEKGSGAAGRRQRFVVGLINRCRCANYIVCSHGNKWYSSSSLMPTGLRSHAWLRVADGKLARGKLTSKC